ncbi:MAG: SDR family oxidoreductase [Deltaproteobacteria bacterium]
MNTTIQNILIVGAKSDIARAIARQYAHQGAALQLVVRDTAEIEVDLADLKIRGASEVVSLHLDLMNTKAISEFVKKLEPMPDVVISAVGYLGLQHVTENEPLEMQRVVGSNYLGPAQLFELIAERMQKRGSGVLVGISSVAGDRGRASNYWYGSAKAGFSAFLSGLRQKLKGSGVRVITVKPGFVRTSMTADMQLPSALTTTPDKVAEDIVKAVQKKRNVLYTPWYWWGIMKIICELPEIIFVRKKF